MNKHRVRLAASIAAAMIATGLGVGITQAAAAGAVTATYSTDSAWGTGIQGKFTINNGTSAATTTWTLTFDLPATSVISSAWDATVTRSGNTYTAVPTWNGAISAGGSISFGYIASGTGTPSNCAINGASCSTGSTTSPSPTAGSPSVSPTASKSPSASPSASPSPSPSTSTPPPSGKKIVGYFPNWGVYARNYHVKNIETSGAASKLTHILYAFGNVTNGQCVLSDSYADYDKAYDAAGSVNGVADTWDAGALRGNFGQLRRLKAMHPGLKVIYSFGGWTYSPGFTQAAQNPTAFANSCYNVVEDSRWADVFDGIDIDWEYPGACGIACDTSTFATYKNLMQALRARFGASAIITSAITADGNSGGKIDAADYAGAAQYVDFYMPMTYDYFGAWAAQGPTAPNAPLFNYPGIPTSGFYGDNAIQKLKSLNIPSSKLLLGIGFYGRGWTGVTQAAPGGTATGPAPGTYEPGIEDYKVLKTSCPATGTVAGTAYAFCNGQWWSYDTPATIAGKMAYANQQGLAGAFFWELTGDTTNGELITAMKNNL